MRLQGGVEGADSVAQGSVRAQAGRQVRLGCRESHFMRGSGAPDLKPQRRGFHLVWSCNIAGDGYDAGDTNVELSPPLGSGRSRQSWVLSLAVL